MIQKYVFISSIFLSLLSSASVLELKANYVIPENENENIPVVARSFAVGYTVLQNEVEGDIAVFTLPQELTGRAISIELKVVEQKMVGGAVVKKLVGPLGEATCVGVWAQAQCRYQMGKLNINPNEVESFLVTKFPQGSPRFEELMTLAGRFNGDPIGEILVVPSAFAAATGSN